MASILDPAQLQVGILSEEQKAKTHAWLIQKWGKGEAKGMPICDMCKAPNMTWTVSEHLMTPVIFADGGLKFGGVVYPVFQVMCSNCGDTHYVNATVAEILETPIIKAPDTPVAQPQGGPNA